MVTEEPKLTLDVTFIYKEISFIEKMRLSRVSIVVVSGNYFRRLIVHIFITFTEFLNDIFAIYDLFVCSCKYFNFFRLHTSMITCRALIVRTVARVYKPE